MTPLPRPFFRFWKSVPAMLLLLTCVGSSCHSVLNPTKKSFYYWKSVFSLTAIEKKKLKELQVYYLYVKFFDVAIDPQTNEAGPVAAIDFKDPAYRDFTIVPVVFITNETLQRMDSTAIPDLADHIAGMVSQISQKYQLPPGKELQLDCDWTARTKDRYFQLITGVRHWLDEHHRQDCRLSATIRLYQCKYRDKTGVPPVDKGLLMCYNMGNLKKPDTRNSIIDVSELEKYTVGLKDYPLPLDVALPVFDWKVYFHQDEYAGLVSDLPTASLKHAACVNVVGNNYTFITDTVINDYGFDEGDRLRDEQSDFSTVDEAAYVVARRLGKAPSTVIFFHLDSTNLSKYSTHELATMYGRFD